MSVPRGFQFSQSSLQDFVDCRRRFELKYLLRFAWPALESEPALENERLMQQGAIFHRLAQQLLLGLPVERLTALAQDAGVQSWWENFLAARQALWRAEDVDGLFPELTLSAAAGDWRLVAKLDLLLHTRDGRLVIFDWKTGRKQPRRAWLSERLQTRLYPALLAQAGSSLFENNEPEKIEMVYWYAEFPDQTLHFPYSRAQFASDKAYITSLIDEIQRLQPGEFTVTSDEKRCAFCVYRSLCERGAHAGDLRGGEWDEFGGSDNLSFDFEQISEIEF